MTSLAVVCRAVLPRCGRHVMRQSLVSDRTLSLQFSPLLQTLRHRPSAQCRFASGAVQSNDVTPDITPAQDERHTVATPETIDVAVTENIQKMKAGTFEGDFVHPESLKHFRTRAGSHSSGSEDANAVTSYTAGEEVPQYVSGSQPPIGTHALPHPIWDEGELNSVEETHKEPERFVDKLAFATVKVARTCFDMLTGYNSATRDERLWINRICFLETVAGVPGMVAAMVRHLHSLRRMRRDHGWIHTLLEEAENERMHLMTALQLKEPGVFFRLGVIVTQGVFVSGFSMAYMCSPRFCHRMVGYLEEEAVSTYTKLLHEIDVGTMQHWNTQQAPYIAIKYWELSPQATMKDVILQIRADEAHHRVVNHTLGSMKPTDYNPYKPGE